MRVLTLNSKAFKDVCCRLREQVDASGFTPDVVIAIATGGVYVATAMDYHDAVSVTLQRAGTKTKRSFLGGLLKRIPIGVADAMRIMESKFLEWKDRRNAELKNPELPDSLVKRLTVACNSVLVVDDAVDSGTTLRSVVESIRRLLPNADIRSAVVTVTRKAPQITPEFSIYTDKTLIRFPWSGDFRPIEDDE